MEPRFVASSSRGLRAQRQVLVPLRYKGLDLKTGIRLDLQIEERVMLEVKSVEHLHEDRAQLLTYLKLTHTRLGLLLNFDVKYLRDGIRRTVSG